MNTAGFVLLVVILIVVAIIAYYIYDTRKRTGIVEDIEITTSATIVTICLQNGSIFYAGYHGNDQLLHSGDRIEFWPTWKPIFSEDIPHSKINLDGTTTTWEKERDYYTLKKFRVIT